MGVRTGGMLRTGAIRRRSTQVQDEKVLKLLDRGVARKTVAATLNLTYWQVTLAVYRAERTMKKRSGR